MKIKSFILKITFIVILFNSCSSGGSEKMGISISFSGAFALYPLAQKWAEEYHKIHPDIRFDIQAGGAGKGLSDALSGAVDVGMFSREITEVEKNKGLWWIALCKDAVLPTVNAESPYIDIIRERGLKKEAFKSIFIDDSPATWDSLFNINSTISSKISVYTRADASGAAEAWASFFGKKQANLKGIAVPGDPGVADAVKKDKNAIGYNNTLFVFDIMTGEKIKGIEVVPIDVNGNGKIDSEENFYEDISTFLEAVNTGKFPSPPARDLYFITKGPPKKKEVIDFFRWVLTDGQRMVHPAGYVPLPPELVREQVKKSTHITYEY